MWRWLILLIFFVASIALKAEAQNCKPPLGHCYAVGKPAWVPLSACYSTTGDSLTGSSAALSVTTQSTQGWKISVDTLAPEWVNGCLAFRLDSMRTGWFHLIIRPLRNTKEYYFDYALLPFTALNTEASVRNPYGFNTQLTRSTAPLFKMSGAGWVHFEDHLTADTNSKPVNIRFEREGDSLIATLPVTPWAVLGDSSWGRNSERGVAFVTAMLLRQYNLYGSFRSMRTPPELQHLDEDGFPQGIQFWDKTYDIRTKVGPFTLRKKRGIGAIKTRYFLHLFPPPDDVFTEATYQSSTLPIKRSDQAVAWAARRRLANRFLRSIDSASGWRIGMVEAIYEPGNFLFLPYPENKLARNEIYTPLLPVLAATQKLIVQADLGIKETFPNNTDWPVLGAVGDIPMAYPWPNAFFNNVLNANINTYPPHKRLDVDRSLRVAPLGQTLDAPHLFGRKPPLGALTFHPYPGNAPSNFATNCVSTQNYSRSTLQGDVDSLLKYYCQYETASGLPKKRPQLWATETGYTSGGSKILNELRMNEERQSRYLPSHFLFGFAAGVDKMIWYGFRDGVTYNQNGVYKPDVLMPPSMDATYDSFSQNPNWVDYAWGRPGVVRATNTVKPSFAAMAMLTHLLPEVPSNFKKEVLKIGYQHLTLFSWRTNDSTRVLALQKDDPQQDTIFPFPIRDDAHVEIYSTEGIRLSIGTGHELMVPLYRDGVTYIVESGRDTAQQQLAPFWIARHYSTLDNGYNAKVQGLAWMESEGTMQGFAADSNAWEKPVLVRIALNKKSGRVVLDTSIAANEGSLRGYLQLGLPGNHGFSFRVPLKWKPAARKGRRLDVFVQDMPSRVWRKLNSFSINLMPEVL